MFGRAVTPSAHNQVAMETIPESAQTVKVALKVRLEPTLAQRRYMIGCAGAARFAFNFALNHINRNSRRWQAQRDAGVEPRERSKPLTLVDLTKVWSSERDQAAPWSNEYPSKVYLFAFRDAVAANRNFLSGRARFPRFKAKHSRVSSFTLCDTIHLRARGLQLTRFGMVRVSAPDERQAQLRRLIRRGLARITSVRVTYYDGHWWAAIAVERAVTSTQMRRVVPPGPVVGTDFGLAVLAVTATSDAEVMGIEAGRRQYQHCLAKTRRLSRQVSRRKRNSKRRTKAVRRLARHHAQLRRRRSDDLHRLSKTLATSHPVVVIEDLNVKGIARSCRLGRATHDRGLGELRRQLTYKAKRTGCRLIVADRFYPSTKTCARCRAVRAKLALGVRIWRCEHCGAVHDRDVCAAANLAAWGEAVLVTEVMATLCGHVNPAGYPDRPGPSATRPRARGTRVESPKGSHARGDGSAGQPNHSDGGTTLGEAGSSQQLVCTQAL
jgi:putative transposase